MSCSEEAPGAQRESIISFGMKLPSDGGSVAISMQGSYTALLVSLLYKSCDHASST